MENNTIDAKTTDIFISYRRVDRCNIARNIQLALKAEGFEQVFYDYTSMLEGKFNEQIITAIYHCKDFILVLSPQSMLRLGKPGDRVESMLFGTRIRQGTPPSASLFVRRRTAHQG